MLFLDLAGVDTPTILKTLDCNNDQNNKRHPFLEAVVVLLVLT
jgi:hypothetical protein